jgi:hypothetical protein
MELADIPGFAQALAAVQRGGGVLLSADAARQLTMAALFVAGPHVRAEVLADTADDIAAMAEHLPPADTVQLLQVATALDQASHDIREALTR